MEYVLASSNAHKIREIGAILGPGHRLIAQSDLGIEGPEETGLSFIENAILKARHAALASGLPALADDSGIAVDALNGAPGVRSARFAGPGASDGANVSKLLDAMHDLPPDARRARFHCVIVVLRHFEDAMPLICQGTWEGSILTEPRGVSGFGYDPVFLCPEYGVSAAELAPEVKNRISHRAKALQQLRLHLDETRR